MVQAAKAARREAHSVQEANRQVVEQHKDGRSAGGGSGSGAGHKVEKAVEPVTADKEKKTPSRDAGERSKVAVRLRRE